MTNSIEETNQAFFHPASYRDPAGRLVNFGDRLLRIVNVEGTENALLFLNASSLAQFRAAGSLVSTRIFGGDAFTDSSLTALQRGISERNESEPLVLEHERLQFVSYPYEWSPEMLAAAGDLTLDLAESLLNEGLGLKDATPFNIVYKGPQPVFVDALSVERRDDLDPIWLPMAEFERTFIYPLLARKYCGLSLAKCFGWGRDGLEPEQMSALAGPIRRWLPPFLGSATLPTLLNGSAGKKGEALYTPIRSKTGSEAKFILQRTFRRLRRALHAATPAPDRNSPWIGYQSEDCHYSEPDHRAKHGFVSRVLRELQPPTVLDLGANEGEYSLLAAELGARVVAVDKDDAVSGRLWTQAKRQSAWILPLTIDLAAPSPSTGWQNLECLSFPTRAGEQFECVMALAFVHHLAISTCLPLESIVAGLAQMTKRWLILELIDTADPKYRQILRGRRQPSIGEGTAVEDIIRRHFRIMQSLPICGGNRRLYALRRNS